jgi:MSHA biogenesis protein MshK
MILILQNTGRKTAGGRFFALRQASWCAVACMAVSGAMAQVMTDPTRPPPGVYAPESADKAAGAPVLQSVMITPTARSAIIGGEEVKLGAKFGDARVIKITESEVVLRTTGGTETLKMYPGVEMKAVQPPPQKAQQVIRKSSRANKSPARNGNEK